MNWNMNDYISTILDSPAETWSDLEECGQTMMDYFLLGKTMYLNHLHKVMELQPLCIIYTKPWNINHDF